MVLIMGLNKRRKSNSIFLKKRGQTSKLMLELGGLVIVALLFIAFASVGTRMLRMFFKDPAVEQAKGNFNALASYVDEVLNDKQDYAAVMGKAINLETDFVILGFDKQFDYRIANSRCDTNFGYTIVPKPTVCGNEACLVLLHNALKLIALDEIENSESVNEGQQSIDEQVISYRIYENVEQFSSNVVQGPGTLYFDFENVPQNLGMGREQQNQIFSSFENSYSPEEWEMMFGLGYLQFYGVCYADGHATEPWGVRNMYIENYRTGVGSATKNYVYIAKQTDKTTERFNTLRAHLAFGQIVNKAKQCNLNFKGRQSYSHYSPFFIEDACNCGETTISLADNFKISLENGKLSLIKIDSGTGSETVLKEDDIRETMHGNLRSQAYALTYPKSLIFQGYNHLFFSRKDGKTVISPGPLAGAINCMDIRDENAIAENYYGQFVETFRYTDPLDFTSPDDGPCIMSRFSFENFPEKFWLYLNKKTDPDEADKLDIKLYDKENSGYIKFGEDRMMYNKPCTLDADGNIVEYESMIAVSGLTGSLPIYTTFFLKDGKVCFDEYANSEKDSISVKNGGQELQYCDWKKFKSDANESFNKVLQYYNDCWQGSGYGDCSSYLLTDLPGNYVIKFRNDLMGTGNKIAAGLYAIGAGRPDIAVREIEVTGRLCSGPNLDADSIVILPNAKFRFYRSEDEGMCIKDLS